MEARVDFSNDFMTDIEPLAFNVRCPMSDVLRDLLFADYGCLFYGCRKAGAKNNSLSNNQINLPQQF
jgi:hypothetical protein